MLIPPIPSSIDSKAHILCNILRFKSTSESEQYKLIHHEYAGLAGVENNEGAASDYSLSTQITEYLTLQTVLKLGLKKASPNENIFYSGGYETALVNACQKAHELATNFAIRKCLDAGFQNCVEFKSFKTSSNYTFWPKQSCYFNSYVKGSN